MGWQTCGCGGAAAAAAGNCSSCRRSGCRFREFAGSPHRSARKAALVSPRARPSLPAPGSPRGEAGAAGGGAPPPSPLPMRLLLLLRLRKAATGCGRRVYDSGCGDRSEAEIGMESEESEESKESEGV